MEAKDHSMLMEHERTIKEHTMRLDQLDSRLNETLSRIEGQNNYLQNQNSEILKSVIETKEHQVTYKHEFKMMNRKYFWSWMLLIFSASSIIGIIVNKLFNLMGGQ